MTIFQAVIFALVQALTEFLPISSTAHLFLVAWLLQGYGWQDPGLTFTVAVHAGTLVGVLGYFLRTWVTFMAAVVGKAYPAANSGEQVIRDRGLFWFLVAGTIPAAVLGYFLEHAVETTFRSPVLMGAMLIVFGIVLWIADQKSTRHRTLDSISLTDALIIGTAQAVALVPGVSRSGITITAGLFRGLTREASARFAFLLSTPIIAGASAKRLLDLRGTTIPPETLASLWLGGLVAAISGYLVIAFFLRYLQTRTLKIFIVYRILFGIVVLLLSFLQMGSP